MDIIDFTKAREARLAKAAKTKTEPAERFLAMQTALEKEDLTAMEYIAQNHALQMAYRLVEHSPRYGIKQGVLSSIWSALETIVPVLGDLIIANSFVQGTVRLTGQKYTANEVGLWAARRLILDYLLILIDDNSRPDDWLDIRDQQPWQNIFVYLGYEQEKI